MENLSIRLLAATLLTVLLASVIGCESDDGGLAPYAGGQQELASITIESESFTPKVTWLGGYAEVFGVNLGSQARLDTSLRWLIRSAGNSLHYPVTFGSLPGGADDLTSAFGGTSLAKFVEDVPYTFWILKEDAWGVVSANPGKALVPDPNASTPARVQGDTVFVSSFNLVLLNDTIDVYVNIHSVDPRGRLADLWVVQTNTSNQGRVTFTIKQTGVTDTTVATIGLCEDVPAFNVNKVIWEILSVDTTGPEPKYRTRNVIDSPVLTGEEVPGTAIFTSFPTEGLKRGKLYYVWIATPEWDGVSRDSRVVPYYSWMTFRTW